MKMTYEEFLARPSVQKAIAEIDNDPKLQEKLNRFVRLAKGGVIKSLKDKKGTGNANIDIDGKFLFYVKETYGLPEEITTAILQDYLNGLDL